MRPELHGERDSNGDRNQYCASEHSDGNCYGDEYPGCLRSL